METTDRGVRCPYCGAEVREGTGRCPTCLRSFTPRPPVAGSPGDMMVLAPGSTPPPVSAPSTAETRLGSTPVPPAADAATGVGPLSPAAPAGPATPAGSATSAGASGPLAAGQNFGPRYHIIKLLGAGGMGAVYQAWDAELNVAVALKVIRPEATADPAAARDLERRFKQELLLARQVTHKNVVRIHDLGEIDGIKYITMPFVEGADLATILQQAGKLPVTAAMHIARQVAAGLQAAHEAGIVHRDLKPANIMIEQEHALIMDFGIARSTSRPGPVAAVGSQQVGLAAAGSVSDDMTRAAATMAGAVVGTVEYMAPEQARAEAADHRADLYAFGLIFYDMLLGPRQASRTESAIEELARRMREAPPSARSIDREIPEALDTAISRCLQPDPAARYQTTAELVAELDRLDDHGVPLPVARRLTRRLVAAVLTVFVVLLAATWWLARGPAPEVERPPMSVLVADFANRTNDPVFTEAVERALGIGLEGASFITSYPREDALRLAARLRPGSRLDESVARLISVREGIKVVLTGSIEPRGRGYALTVRAIDPAVDNKVLATTSLTASSKDQVLKAVGSAAARLRGQLGDTTPESARLAAAETFTAASLEAMQAYARGQELARANRNQEAQAAYEQAISLDPKFGRAYAGLGVIHTIYKDEARAKAAYEQALKNVDRMTEREKYRTLGTYYLSVARNYEKAIENYETLVKLYPADRAGRANLALAYLNTGNIKGAVAQVREVLNIYPRNSLQRYNYAMYSMYAGDFQTAIAEGTRIVKENPSFEYAFLPIALSTVARGDIEGARGTYQQLENASPSGASLANLGRADLEMYQGRYRQGLSLLLAGIEADTKTDNTAGMAQKYVAAADAYLMVKQPARAVDAARRAIKLSEHESVLVPAARVLLQAGREGEAQKIALMLENRLQAHTTAYAKLIGAEIAVRQGRYAEAIEAFRDSIKRRDTWLARFLLGRTYAEADHFPEAMAELEICVNRRGETTDVFFYDMPTLRYLPPAYYWLGRAQQAMGVADHKKNFEQFLALRAAADPPDPLAADARKRLNAQP